jgi:hypothetical protein
MFNGAEDEHASIQTEWQRVVNASKEFALDLIDGDTPVRTSVTDSADAQVEAEAAMEDEGGLQEADAAEDAHAEEEDLAELDNEAEDRVEQDNDREREDDRRVDLAYNDDEAWLPYRLLKRKDNVSPPRSERELTQDSLKRIIQGIKRGRQDFGSGSNALMGHFYGDDYQRTADREKATLYERSLHLDPRILMTRNYFYTSERDDADTRDIRRGHIPVPGFILAINGPAEQGMRYICVTQHEAQQIRQMQDLPDGWEIFNIATPPKRLLPDPALLQLRFYAGQITQPTDVDVFLNSMRSRGMIDLDRARVTKLQLQQKSLMYDDGREVDQKAEFSRELQEILGPDFEEALADDLGDGSGLQWIFGINTDTYPLSIYYRAGANQPQSGRSESSWRHPAYEELAGVVGPSGRYKGHEVLRENGKSKGKSIAFDDAVVMFQRKVNLRELGISRKNDEFSIKLLPIPLIEILGSYEDVLKQRNYTQSEILADPVVQRLRREIGLLIAREASHYHTEFERKQRQLSVILQKLETKQGALQEEYNALEKTSRRQSRGTPSRETAQQLRQIGSRLDALNTHHTRFKGLHTYHGNFVAKAGDFMRRKMNVAKTFFPDVEDALREERA